jgi:hypothetical protein
MYSPKIPERFIPALYRLARDRGEPMTRLVAEAVERLLVSEGVVLEPPEPRPNRRQARTPAGVYERAPGFSPSARAPGSAEREERRGAGSTDVDRDGAIR